MGSAAVIRNVLSRLWYEEHGATAVEYAALLAMIFLAVVGTVAVVGEKTGSFFQNATDQFSEHGM